MTLDRMADVVQQHGLLAHQEGEGKRGEEGAEERHAGDSNSSSRPEWRPPQLDASHLAYRRTPGTDIGNPLARTAR